MEILHETETWLGERKVTIRADDLRVGMHLVSAIQQCTWTVDKVRYDETTVTIDAGGHPRRRYWNDERVDIILPKEAAS